MISRIHKKVSKSEGGNLFGRDIMILHEGCEGLTNVMTSIFCPFDVFSISIRIFKKLTGVTVEILDYAGTREWECRS